MSDNKYIIDKDSLTGIADAVRNKLGTGNSIDDENAGYYPASGYVLKFNTIQKAIGGKGTNILFSISNWNEQFKTWCGKVPEKIRFRRTTNSAYTTIYCNGVEVLSPSMGSPTEKTNIISYPTNGRISITEYNGYNSYAVTPYAITIEFLDSDENSLGIINGDTSFSYDGQTISFLTGSYNVAIPFTLNDIQNKITNYLKTSESKKSKIALLSDFYVKGTRYAQVTGLKPYGGLSNIDLIVGRYDSNGLGYLDMVNHPDKVGTYNGYDTYRFYRYNAGGTETYLMDVQYDTSYGNDQLYQMEGYYGLTLSPCFIIYREATE